MHPHAEIVREIVIVLAMLGWMGFGIWLTHKTRKSEYLEKILVAVFFTKGFLCYWFSYGLFYVLGKTAINFIKGMKEGHIERQETDNKDEDN